MLGRGDVSGVIVTSATSRHKDLMLRAAAAGKHIFTEKVLAPTLEEGAAIARAVIQNDIQFAISYPHRCKPANQFAKSTLDQGLLGPISHLRIRNAHNGAGAGWLPEHFYDRAACGGGAMIDLGAHGMYLALWLLGWPQTVSAVFGHMTGRAVEDNAVAVLGYASGSTAINETGFASQDSPFSLELYGQQGCLLCGGPKDTVQVKNQNSSSWQTITQLPPALPRALDQWVQGILGGDTIFFDINEALALTQLMDAAYQAQQQSRTITLPPRLTVNDL